MAGNGNGNGESQKARRISLVEAKFPVGTAEIMGDDGKPRDVLVYPPSTGSQEELLVLTENIAAGQPMDAKANLALTHRIVHECAPDLTPSEVRRFTEEQAGELIAFAQSRGDEVEKYIESRRASLNPQPAAASTQKPPKSRSGKGSAQPTGSGSSSSPS